MISLRVSLLRDDGGIVYLNGTEIFRSNMPEGAVDYLTFSSSVVGGGDETTYFDQQVDPSLLRDGANVLAVELHQVNATSTDLLFDLELAGMVNFSNEPPTANAGPNLAVQLPNGASLNGTASDDGLPNPPGVYNANWSMVTGPGSVSFGNANLPQTTATFSQAGTYILRLTVTDGELTATDEIEVTVTGGADPYELWKNQNFTAGELADPQISGDSADPDGDTFTNQQEYIAGTKPKDAASFLHVAEVSRGNNGFLIQFEAVGDKSYTIVGRDAVETGPWRRIVDLPAQGTTDTVGIEDPTAQPPPRRYYRVVTPPLPPE